MCTAISYTNNGHYFGRNLDLERSYMEQVTITPRKYPLVFQNGQTACEHYALIGMACVYNQYPLYFDAMNEKGLCAAGLNFMGNAVYSEPGITFRKEISPYELIPYLLSSYASVDEAVKELEQSTLVSIPFSKELPLTPLHWILSDAKRTVTVESVTEGIKIYENEIGVLTNNPPFPFHMDHLSLFMHLTPAKPQNHFAKQMDVKPFSLGMGALGLPGDFSSASRFVKASFVKTHGICGENEEDKVGHFFHLLSSVEMPKGCVETFDKQYEYTQYSSCCNAKEGIYYYRTYENSQITAVFMKDKNINGKELICFPLRRKQHIAFEN